MKEKNSKTPWHLFLIGTVFTFIYLIGFYDFFMIHSNNLNYINALESNKNVLSYFSNYPIILSILWALNITGGLNAAILLFFRHKWTVWFSLISVISLVVLDASTFLFRNRWEVFGPQLSITDFTVLIVSIAFYWYCNKLKKQGVLD
jgi:hypothetical protein